MQKNTIFMRRALSLFLTMVMVIPFFPVMELSADSEALLTEWSVVRENDQITVNPDMMDDGGSVTIVTEGWNENYGGVNNFVTRPLTKEDLDGATDFTITAKVSGGLSQNYQAVGIAAHMPDDTGSIVTALRRRHFMFGGDTANRNFGVMQEGGQGASEAYSGDVLGNAPAWLKLKKTGDEYATFYSYTNLDYNEAEGTDPETSWVPCAPTNEVKHEDLTAALAADGINIGFFASSGGSNNPIAATVSDFRLNGTLIPVSDPDTVDAVTAVPAVVASLGTEFAELLLPATVETTLASGATYEAGVEWIEGAYDPDSEDPQTVYGDLAVAASANPDDLQASVEVTLTDALDAISILPAGELWLAAVSDTATLAVQGTAVDGFVTVDPATCDWTSSDDAVATVEDGVVTAVAEGYATITCEYLELTTTVDVVVGAPDGEAWQLASPDGTSEIRFKLDEDGVLSYAAVKDGQYILDFSAIGLVTSAGDFSEGLAFDSASSIQTVNETYDMLTGKFAEYTDNYQEQSITFTKGGVDYIVVARAYNDGVAFRHQIAADEDNLTISNEPTYMQMPEGSTVWTTMRTGESFEYQSRYDEYTTDTLPVSEITPPAEDPNNNQNTQVRNVPVFPVLYELPDKNADGEAVYGMLHEAHLSTEYLGSSMYHEGDGVLRLIFDVHQADLGDVETSATEAAPWQSPWRVVLGGSLEDMVETMTVENLNPAPDEDTYNFSEWVKPGVAAWSWVSFYGGQAIKDHHLAFIDLAAEMGWDYYILDEGWQPRVRQNGENAGQLYLTDGGGVAAGVKPFYGDEDYPDADYRASAAESGPYVGQYSNYDGRFDWFDEVSAHAQEKGVDLIAWVHSRDMSSPEWMRKRLAEWSELGIKGIKTDFFYYESQERMPMYEELFKVAAEYGMVVNVHGSNKPTGEMRTWPNNIAREAIDGQESGGLNAFQYTISPFSRGAVGTADITEQVSRDSARATNGFQAALSVMFENGMHSLGSGPAAYLDDPVVYSLYKNFPSRWSEVQFIDGEVAEYASLARKAYGTDDWYAATISNVGGTKQLTGGAPAFGPDFVFTSEITTDFLDEGETYYAMIYREKVREGNEDQGYRNALQLDIQEGVEKGDVIEVPMQPSGGCVVVFKKALPVIEGLDVTDKDIDIRKFEYYQIPFIYANPDTAALRELNFVSSDPDVASVSPTGLISGDEEGTATITITPKYQVPGSDIEVVLNVTVDEAAYDMTGGWEILRRDEDFTVLSESSVQIYSASGNAEDPEGESLKVANLVLREFPNDKDWEAVVKMGGGLDANYQTGGLIAYADEETLAIAARRSHSMFGGNVFDFRSPGGEWHTNGSDTQDDADAYLKLIKTGNLLKAYYSYNGVTFTPIDPQDRTYNIGTAATIKLGLVAANGNGNNDGADMVFSDFQFKQAGDANFTSYPFAVSNLLITPENNGVTVTPATADVVTGGRLQFAGAAEEVANQTMDWSVTGGKAGTAIDESGLLTVAADEVIGAQLVVKAVSALDDTKWGTAVVTVVAPVPTLATPTTADSQRDMNRLILRINHELLTAANYQRWVTDYSGADKLEIWYTDDGTTPVRNQGTSKLLRINPAVTAAGALNAPRGYILDFTGGTEYKAIAYEGNGASAVMTYVTPMNVPRLDIDNNIDPATTNNVRRLTSGLYKQSDLTNGIGLFSDSAGAEIYYVTASVQWNGANSQFGASAVDALTAEEIKADGTLFAANIPATGLTATNGIAIRAIAVNGDKVSDPVTYQIRMVPDNQFIELEGNADGEVTIDLDAFIAQLTVEEKLMLLSGVGGDPIWLQNGYNFPVESNNDGILRTGGPAGGTATLPRFNIPSTALADGPAGVRMWKNATIWMAPAGVGSTWNAGLAEQVGQRYAEESKHYAIDYVLGPGVNNQRNPVSGRNFEYYSEDPYILGLTGAAQVRGMQAGGLMATPKHFAANDYETGRQNSAYATERALREIYLRAFEIMVQEGHPWTMMTGYNAINSVDADHNPWLTTTVLRDEWGFEGFVMTDWGGDTGTLALEAQTDMSQSAVRNLANHTAWLNDAANGARNFGYLNRSVKNVLQVLVKTFAFQGEYGVLQPDGTYADGTKLDGTPVVGIDSEDIGSRHLAFGGSDVQEASEVVNKQVADEAIVLLRNDDATLPLQGNEKIALVTSRKAWQEFSNPRWYGDSASVGDLVIQGTGSAQVRFNNSTADYAPTLVEALEANGFSVTQQIDLGILGNNNQEFIDAYADNMPEAMDGSPSEKYVFGEVQSKAATAELAAYTKANGIAENTETAKANAKAAAEAAAAANDVGIFVMTRISGEGADVPAQLFNIEPKELIVYEAYEKAFKDAGKKFIVLLNVGGTTDTTAYRGGEVVAHFETTAGRPAVVIDTDDYTATTQGADAILDVWNPGSAGTAAIADILTGDVNPSGKLAQTFPVGFEDSPSVYMFNEYNEDHPDAPYPGNGYNNAAYYADGVYVGYRFYESRPELYDDMVAYPFGYGLSYTTFEFSEFELDKNVFSNTDQTDKITATVKVTNTGAVAGKEVVQLYLNASTWEEEGRPKNELRAYGKTGLLQPGASEVVTLTIDYEDLVYFNDNNPDATIRTDYNQNTNPPTYMAEEDGWTVADGTTFTATIRTNAENAAKPNVAIAGLTAAFGYGAEPAAPTVTGVTVRGTSSFVEPGGVATFSATVAGENSPSQAVTWAVTGGMTGTSITNNGVLTIASGEATGTKLTLRATSVADTTKSGSVTVTVDEGMVGEASYKPAESDLTVKYWVTATATTGNAGSAIDGDLATAWAPTGTGANVLTVNLGGAYDAIYKTEIVFDTANVAHKYKLEGSADGTNWTVLKDNTANARVAKGFTDVFSMAGLSQLRITVTGAAEKVAEFNVFNYLREDMDNGSDTSGMAGTTWYNVVENTAPGTIREGVMDAASMTTGENFFGLTKDMGWDTIRLRIWNTPRSEGGWQPADIAEDGPFPTRDLITNDNCSPTATYDKAKYIVGAGQRLAIDFHYSDSWSDPQNQPKPYAWAYLPWDDPTTPVKVPKTEINVPAGEYDENDPATYELVEKGLVSTVEDFTYETIGALIEQGTAPAVVALGNEITNGMMWGTEYKDTNPFANFHDYYKRFIRDNEYATQGGGVRWSKYEEADGNVNSAAYGEFLASVENLSELINAGQKAIDRLNAENGLNIETEIHFAFNVFEQPIAAGASKIDLPPDEVYAKVLALIGNIYKNLDATEEGMTDRIGISYYPDWHGTYDNVQRNIVELSKLMPEVDFNIAECSPKNSGVISDWMMNPNVVANPMNPDTTLPDEFTQTMQWQGDDTVNIMKMINDVPNNVGQGVWPWNGQAVYFTRDALNGNDYVMNASFLAFSQAFATGVVESKVYVTTAPGVAPALPATVKELTIDGKAVADVNVTWASVPAASYAADGAFEVKGTANANGNMKDVVAVVTVGEGIASTVTGVSVSSATVSVQQGKTATFTATVTGTGNPSTAVTWSVTGGTTGTSISAAGVLTVAAAEAVGTQLTVKATSVADNTKSGTATVTVLAASTDGPGGGNDGPGGGSTPSGGGQHATIVNKPATTTPAEPTEPTTPVTPATPAQPGTPAPTQPSFTYTDTQTHWAKDDIVFVSEAGLFGGTGGGQFSPNISMSRAMVVTALAKYLKADVSGFTSASFSDTASGAWYTPYVAWAAQNGVVSGYTDGTFAPDKAVTREEMAVILMNFVMLNNLNLGEVVDNGLVFTDEAAISAWAKEAVTYIKNIGAISGRTDGSFDPKATATRAEVASMLRRFLERVVQ